MTKIQHKRTKTVEKLWYIIKPFLLYTIVKTFAMIGLSLLLSTFPSEEMTSWVQNNSRLLSTTINGLAAVVGIFFVLQDFLIEVSVTGEVNIDGGVFRQIAGWIKNGISHNKDKAFLLAAVVILGITSALALNILVELLSVSSEKYDNVEAIQYSVPIWLGLLLYGIVSPVTEEIVFRGITYNRMKRYYSVVPCVIVSALLFGGFHANLPQFLYGTCMGVLMALVYEWVRSFAAPLLFHMAANVIVFVLSECAPDMAAKMTVLHCAAFAVIAGGLVIYLYRKRRN